MAIKTIRFRVNSSPTIADGADGILLATLVNAGEYAGASAISGIVAGWIANATGGIADAVGISGDPKFGQGRVRMLSGTSRRLRINRPAGTFTVRMQGGMINSGVGYATPRLRILDADNATVLYAQTGGDVITDGDPAPAQINTNGSKQAVGASDAGVSITTTGSSFVIDIPGSGTFGDWVSYIEWDDGAGGGATPTITGIAPTSGPVGTEVTITGTNLTGATVATHGPTVAMTGLVVDSATQGRATIASGSPASGTIRITTPGGTAASSASFTIPPIFTSLEITGIPGSYTIGVLLAPITVRALDQFGATFLGTLADCVVSALTLPVTVIGTLTEPFVAGIATFDNLTPAESAGPPIEVITVATPLRCTVSLFPVTSVPIEGTSGGGIPTLIARTASDHVLRIEDIVHAITGAVVEPTDIRYRLSDASGVLLNATVTAPTNPDDWQIALTRALFTPTRGPMTLVLTLVAPVDSTETALQFTIAQGVRQ
jgi:hypothetical protein